MLCERDNRKRKLNILYVRENKKKSNKKPHQNAFKNLGGSSDFHSVFKEKNGVQRLERVYQIKFEHIV